MIKQKLAEIEKRLERIEDLLYFVLYHQHPDAKMRFRVNSNQLNKSYSRLK